MLFKFNRNVALSLVSVMQMVIYAGFLLIETPGKGTVSSLWLLFLEMRAQDSAQKLKLSSLHVEILTLLFWKKW